MFLYVKLLLVARFMHRHLVDQSKMGKQNNTITKQKARGKHDWGRVYSVCASMRGNDGNVINYVERSADSLYAHTFMSKCEHRLLRRLQVSSPLTVQ